MRVEPTRAIACEHRCRAGATTLPARWSPGSSINIAAITLKLRIACLLSVLLAAACGTVPAPSNVAMATYVIVRHAEKAAAGGSDPALTAEGRARAKALAVRLAEADIVAVYATGFRRTQATAAPTAAAHRVAVSAYDASMPAVDFASRLRREHTSGTVLVVGHSNTVPEIVAALCACAVDPIDDGDYGNLYEVRVDAGGTSSLVRKRF